MKKNKTILLAFLIWSLLTAIQTGMTRMAEKLSDDVKIGDKECHIFQII